MTLAERIKLAKNRNNHGVPHENFLYDLVFVLNVNSKGWILEKVCKVIEATSGLHCGWVYSERNDRLTNPLPQAHAYFFAHYQIACHTLTNNPEVWFAKRFVYFTHPDFGRGLSPNDVVAGLKEMDKIFCMNTSHQRFLETLGIDESSIKVAIGGADPDVFSIAEGSTKKVGFIGAYYSRKNPDLVFDTISRMRDTNFVLIAPSETEIVNPAMSWRNYPRFEVLISLSNLEYIEANYADYPAIYRKLDRYVSLSYLEGGPISLLETMLCGIYPIVTDTGFARDVITSEDIGVILPLRCTQKDISAAISQQPKSQAKIRDVALEYTWEKFGNLVAQEMGLSLAKGSELKMTQDIINPCLISGWWPSEATGVWSNGKQAHLHLPISKQLQGHSFTAVLSIWTLKEFNTELDLMLNNDHYDTITIDGEAPARIPVEVTADQAKRGAIDLALIGSRMTTPKTLGINNDERTLSFKLGSLAIR